MSSDIPGFAEVTKWIDEHWDLSSEPQRKMYGYILAVANDNFKRAALQLYDRLRAADDTQQAQAALEAFYSRVNDSAYSRDMDLQAAAGEHNSNDPRRADFFNVANLTRGTRQ